MDRSDLIDLLEKADLARDQLADIETRLVDAEDDDERDEVLLEVWGILRVLRRALRALQADVSALQRAYNQAERMVVDEPADS